MTTGLDVTIRSATADDISNIVSLWRELMGFHEELDPYFATADDGAERMAEWITTCIGDEEHIVLIADADSEPAGYIVAGFSQRPPVMRDRDIAMIYDLSVTQRLRRQGIGERLVREALLKIEERGVKLVEVSYVVDNEQSSSFWPKMGFEPFLMRGRLDLSADS